MTIEEEKDLTTLTMDELMGTLQTHEHQINKSATTSQEQSFKAQENSRGWGRGRNRSGRSSRSRGCGRNGQRNSSAKSLGRASSQEGASTSQKNSRGGKKNYNSNKSNVECYYCHKYGHYASECWKKQGDQSKQNDNVADVNMGNANNPTAFIMCNIGEEGSPKVWYLDNGCSNHMSRNESLFSFIDKNFKSEIKMGNNGIISILGKGSIMVCTKQGEKKEIQNVYFSPSMKHNLMIVGQLIQI